MSEFKRIRPDAMSGNFISQIGSQWALLTAAKPDGTYNTMTVSWGGVGVLWGKPVCFLFVRSQRYTHQFTEAGDRITLSFFGDTYREKLAYCGRVSGRDTDKAADCGLTPARKDGYVFFAEASRVIACRKLYADEIREGGFLDPATVEAHYKTKDFHTVYVCEIVAAADAV